MEIKCPVCGQQYHPAEIYLPNEFFGKPKEVVKNSSGQIEFVLGKDMNPVEEYICDNCNTKFRVTADISFETEIVNKNIEEEYVSTFERPKKLKLTEEELF